MSIKTTGRDLLQALRTALAALLYITRTNDIHHENLIACGDQPVIVDTDTLFYPGFYDLIENSDDFGKNYIELAIEESVVSSGLLPFGIRKENTANSETPAA